MPQPGQPEGRRLRQGRAVHGLPSGHTVAESMSRVYPEIAGDAALQELLGDHLLGEGRRSTEG